MNKTVVITGATGNLGTAVTAAFLEKGYQVVATISSEKSRKELPQHGNLQAEVVNLTDEAETAYFVQNTIDKYKTIDAALLLVGGFAAGNISATKGDDVKKQISL